MKKIICTAFLVLLTMNAPAHAQLTPVYGWLRTALENSMAQALPPYGKANRPTAADHASLDNGDSTEDRKRDDTMKNAAAAEQQK